MQFIVGRQANKRRRRELVASFLSIQESITLVASENEGTDPAWVGAWRSGIRDQYALAAGIGHELALLCMPRVSKLILLGLHLSLKVWTSTDPNSTNPDERRGAINSLRDNTDGLSELLHGIYGGTRWQRTETRDRGMVGLHAPYSPNSAPRVVTEGHRFRILPVMGPSP